MRSRLARTCICVGVALATCLALGGCKKDAEFSKEELSQMKNGPKEMPAEAKQLMSQMGKGGNAGAPPRPVGQPGPGSPLAAGPGK